MFCSHCGYAVPVNVNFCSSCGSPVAMALAAVGSDGRPVGVLSSRPAAASPLAVAVPATVSPASRWRSASDVEIGRAKNLNNDEWTQVGREFKEWRKTVTLTPIGRVLTHNSAWDNYYSGYRDGVEAGVNRALCIGAQDAADIEEHLAEVDIARLSNASGRSATTPEREQLLRSFGLGRTVGVILSILGVVGLAILFTGASNLSNGLPNALNFSLLTAFGLVTWLRRPVALLLGWSYLFLLAGMTVLHGFVPLEILQCLALVGFLVYLHRHV